MTSMTWRLVAASILGLVVVGTALERPALVEAGVSPWHQDARRPMDWDWNGGGAPGAWLDDGRRPGDWLVDREGGRRAALDWLADDRRPGNWMVDRASRGRGPDAWRDDARRAQGFPEFGRAASGPDAWHDDFRRPLARDWGPGRDMADAWRDDSRRPGSFISRMAPAPAPTAPAVSDSDGDGVPDDRDRCPDTPRRAEVDSRGYPKDSDGDGVYDGIDRCPDTPRQAAVDSRGCPKDSDGDGVYDGIDRCPDTPRGATVDRHGCPEIDRRMEEQLLDTGTLRLRGVNFDFNKATIRPESYEVLDEVGRILAKWSELRVEVGGHTDSRGSEAYNQSLSERRAAAVRNYLVKNFTEIRDGQLTSKGYGETMPVAGNDTEAGRFQNRRVEFKVLNRGVLRRR